MDTGHDLIAVLIVLVTVAILFSIMSNAYNTYREGERLYSLEVRARRLAESILWDSELVCEDKAYTFSSAKLLRANTWFSDKYSPNRTSVYCACAVLCAENNTVLLSAVTGEVSNSDVVSLEYPCGIWWGNYASPGRLYLMCWEAMQ
ncbi:MAG: hypothetical protein DRN20_05885 [Thermoplasmata archaeon]|nr:MAG: hypothetical protein DRN20_05885 [Thermoplasmata archaeon]